MISDADLVEWGRRGIFPGPRESVSGFLQRARECSVVSEPAVNCFGVKPNWIPIRLDAQNLSLWEAAATWIEESEEGVSCFIQIHPSGKYPKEQVIAHEMVHAMRMGFEEPYFEEVLAYQTSSHWFRRYFGPLFVKGYEIKVFLALVLLGWSLLVGEVLFEKNLAASVFLFLPIFFVGWCVLRLVFLQRTFQKCLSHLKKVMKQDPLALAMRLTDAEIRKFSKSTPSEIQSYMQQSQELRWRQINLEFFAL